MSKFSLIPSISCAFTEYRSPHASGEKHSPAGATLDDDDLGRLRGELLARFDAHPVKHWSPNLIRVVIAALDLVGPSVPPEPVKRVNLRIVR